MSDRIIPKPLSWEKWMPDEDAPQCTVCAVKFSLLRRRHHCRLCGTVICADCSRTWKYGGAVIEHFRGCEPCVSRLEAQERRDKSIHEHQHAVLNNTFSKGNSDVKSVVSNRSRGESFGAKLRLSDPIEAAIARFLANNDISPPLIEILRRLALFHIVVVCDNSATMNQRYNSTETTKWEGARETVRFVVELANAMEKVVDFYFLDSNAPEELTDIEMVERVMGGVPAADTDPAMDASTFFEKLVASIDQKPKMPYLFFVITDGECAKQGDALCPRFEHALRDRPFPKETLFSFNLFSRDGSTAALFRELEYRVQGRYGWVGPSQGIIGVDVTLDFENEASVVAALRGSNFPFARGDYLLKVLAGCIDPRTHSIDLPVGQSPNDILNVLPGTPNLSPQNDVPPTPPTSPAIGPNASEVAIQ